MHGPRQLRRAGRSDRRFQRDRPGQHRADPRGVLSQLLRRAQTESAHIVISVRLGLRLGRWGVFGFSLAALLSIFVQTAGFYQIAGHTLAERLQFGASMAALEAQFVALFAPTIRPDTVEGFV